jgi:hypothetical protein
MMLVAILTVKREAIGDFRRFERGAAELMKSHGGRIEKTVVVNPDGTPDLIKEIHLVSFPSEAAFQSYRNDQRLAGLSRLREQSVVHSEILVGEEGPVYAGR